MTSVSPTTSLMKLAKQQIRMLARSIVREGSCMLGWHERVLALAIRRSESMLVALDDWIRSGERKNGGCWFVWEVRPAPMCGFSSPWRVGWQERFHARTQPAR